MAEAQREEEEEGERRDLRDVRGRIQPADHPERTKPDHFHSSPGPLSSIRAAIKRTRTNSQGDITRDRRRPEITIISAEPLVSNNWFPGTSVVFSPPPQSGWSAGIQTVSQPPPSYDQVIKETQEEHILKPTAAPRQSTCTTTSATQTDPVREDAAVTVPQCSATPPSAKKRSAGKKPQKPPRPSLPKPVDREPAAVIAGPSDGKVATNTTASTNTEEQCDSKTDIKEDNQAESTQAYTRSVTVHWDIPVKHTPQPPSASAIPAETTPPSSDSEHSHRPVPLPRIKSRNQAIKEEAKVQTLVKLSENCDNVQVASVTDPEDFSSNKYLKELLEVFSVDNECEDNSDYQSDEASQGEDASRDMSASHSQRNIRARIQALESQTENGNVVEPAKPEPLPRKATNKPPVAAKPSVSFKPQLNHSVDNDNQNVPTTNIPQSPTPAPRPLPPRKPAGLSVREELDTLLAKGPVPHRSRPSLLTRANSIYEEETLAAPPTLPVKPSKEPLKPNLNINNHNSTVVRGWVDSPSNQIPVKPQRNVDNNEGSFTRNSVTRRPTTIRVPSKSDLFSDHVQDSPPPLPAQKPIGSLNTSVKKSLPPIPIQPSQEVFNVGPEPSLPPRKLSTSKSLPPRPPPAKTGPGRPPPPNLQATGRSQSRPKEASPKPQTQKPHRKGPVLPPRPNPGHRLYNKYTLQLPHGITVSDYNGSNTGELSFQKNEVLLLLEEIDHNTFECQVGDTRGRVNKSRMKVITPLDSVLNMPSSQSASPAGSGGTGSGLKVQAIHDFTPEGPGELGLRAGDIVSMVEQVDSEWYRGTCRGSTGFFPVNYVNVLSDSSKPIVERKAKPASARVSGPRCMARFDFEGEHSDELTFTEGDIIQLKEYVGQDWARGQIGVSTGIFPLNFVEVIEDLPPPPSQQQMQPNKIALPGMVASPSANPKVASQATVEWTVAMYDFSGKSGNELSFQQGDCILITQHINDEWSCGRLNGKEGMFPRAFVESSTAGQQSSNTPQNRAAGGGTGRALFDFTSDCDEELSLKVGDVVTNLESIDEEWFLGDLRGKRALVPKNYVEILG
ncbi:SH3 domain-containing protein 19 [Scomber scombrus]|uniref:SH3 domain-containing protein 19 n=1 Tax=Scomber scombrus TaxID=13677 RepID=UPI002DD8255B|nr:SH3 domain-containing protein 19 [Scomber scombrus]